MLARAGSSPPRDFSPAPNGTYGTTQVAGRKRKLGGGTSATPELESPNPDATPAGPVDKVLLIVQKFDARPRLTISRHPTFVPVAEGSEYNTTESTPMNRMGYRYIPAGLGPIGTTTCRTIESNPASFRVSWEDRSAFIKVTTDGLGLCGERGFRSARCNVPVREGNWYMEIKIEHGGGDKMPEPSTEGSHVRLGWGRREAPLNAPVGLDGYSYGIRDKTGEKVTLSRPHHYARPFKTGDVVGMYISLPHREQTEEQLRDPYNPALLKRRRIAIDSRGQEYFEILEVQTSKEMKTLMDKAGNPAANTPLPPSSNKKSATTKNLPTRGRGRNQGPAVKPSRTLPTLPGSKIAFFINGESQGVAFEDIYDYLQLRTADRKTVEKQRRNKDGAIEHQENPFDDGTLGYYAQISLFNSARVTINPGPNFDFPPPPDIEAVLSGETETIDLGREPTWRPVSDRYPEYMKEQWAMDDWELKEWEAGAAEQAEMDAIERERDEKRKRKREESDARKRARKDAESEFHHATLDADLPHGSPLRYEAANAMDVNGQSERYYSPELSVEPWLPTTTTVNQPPSPTRSELYGQRGGYSPSRRELFARRAGERSPSPPRARSRSGSRERSRERFVASPRSPRYSHVPPVSDVEDHEEHEGYSAGDRSPARSYGSDEEHEPEEGEGHTTHGQQEDEGLAWEQPPDDGQYSVPDV